MPSEQKSSHSRGVLSDSAPAGTVSSSYSRPLLFLTHCFTLFWSCIGTFSGAVLTGHMDLAAAAKERRREGHFRGSESAHEEPPFPLADLPDDCLAAALAHCSPKDLGRLACVSHSWQAAAQSELAWPTISKWREDFGAYFAALRGAKPPPEVFQDAVKGITSDDGRYRLQADVDSGRLTVQVSVWKNCHIALTDETGENDWWAIREGVPGSDFPKCAYLKTVCWFHIGGNLSFPFKLPAGRYTVSWSVGKVRRTRGNWGFEWDGDAARCSVVLPSDNKVIDEVPIDFRLSGRPKSANGPATNGVGIPPTRDLCWELFPAGIIELPPDGRGSAPLEARIDLRETVSLWWKSKLFLDSIHFTPC